MQPATNRQDKAPAKGSLPTSSSFEERYATLQHKLDRLQKVHSDGKKTVCVVYNGNKYNANELSSKSQNSRAHGLL